jgi:4-diphosphocytidyl-2-C-methyl-D-erythritol kinase
MTYTAYAKINLTLDITGKRDDGYHSIESVMQTVSLCDTLTFRFSERNDAENSITVSSSDKALPTDEKNICFRACDLFFKEFGICGKNVEIFIEKDIPVGAGLGGGSSDCAETLKALNDYFGINADAHTLEALGARLGADVPFFIRGGCMKTEGIGEIVSGPFSAGDFFIALIVPEETIFSGDIYREFDELFYNNKASLPKPSTGAFLAGKERWKHVSNMLTAVSERKSKKISAIKELLLSLGALAAEMSGSGPAVFGIFENSRDASKAVLKLKNSMDPRFCGVYKTIFN